MKLQEMHKQHQLLGRLSALMAIHLWTKCADPRTELTRARELIQNSLTSVEAFKREHMRWFPTYTDGEGNIMASPEFLPVLPTLMQAMQGPAALLRNASVP
jgi:hypothetical protein